MSHHLSAKQQEESLKLVIHLAKKALSELITSIPDPIPWEKQIDYVTAIAHVESMRHNINA